MSLSSRFQLFYFLCSRSQLFNFFLYIRSHLCHSIYPDSSYPITGVPDPSNSRILVFYILVTVPWPYFQIPVIHFPKFQILAIPFPVFQIPVNPFLYISIPIYAIPYIQIHYYPVVRFLVFQIPVFRFLIF